MCHIVATSSFTGWCGLSPFIKGWSWGRLRRYSSWLLCIRAVPSWPAFAFEGFAETSGDCQCKAAEGPVLCVWLVTILPSLNFVSGLRVSDFSAWCDKWLRGFLPRPQGQVCRFSEEFRRLCGPGLRKTAVFLAWNFSNQRCPDPWRGYDPIVNDCRWHRHAFQEHGGRMASGTESLSLALFKLAQKAMIRTWRIYALTNMVTKQQPWVSWTHRWTLRPGGDAWLFLFVNKNSVSAGVAKRQTTIRY